MVIVLRWLTQLMLLIQTRWLENAVRVFWSSNRLRPIKGKQKNALVRAGIEESKRRGPRSRLSLPFPLHVQNFQTFTCLGWHDAGLGMAKQKKKGGAEPASPEKPRSTSQPRAEKTEKPERSPSQPSSQKKTSSASKGLQPGQKLYGAGSRSFSLNRRGFTFVVGPCTSVLSTFSGRCGSSPSCSL